jgi:phage/plasmid-associated DNA primase
MTSNSEIINNVEQGGKPLLTETNSLNSICKKNENINDIVVDKEMSAKIFDDSKFNPDKIKNKDYKINVFREWTLKEEVDIRDIAVIVDNIEILKDKIGLGWDRKTNQRLDWFGTQTVIANYCKQIRKGGHVEYKPSKKSKKGRHFSKTPSLQGICRPVRHTLVRDGYLDIDMSNCHPVVFVSLCKTYNFDCSHVLFYIENREKCLTSMMEWTCRERDWCKQTVLSLLNGGDCSEIFHYLGVVIPDSCKWISDFKKQVEAIHQNFFEHPTFTDHKKELIKEIGLNQFNFNGKLVNKVLCEFENILIQHAMNYCYENGIEIGANCFDGLLLKKSEILNDAFIKSMEDYVVNEVGIPVKFVVKEMDEGFDISGLKTNAEKKEIEKIDKANLKAQEKYEKDQQKLKEKSEITTFQEKLSDENLAKVFIAKTDEFLFKDTIQNAIYFYNESNCLYERLETIDHLKNFFTDILKDYFEDMDTENEMQEECKVARQLELKSARGASNLLAFVRIQIPDSTKFIMDNFNRKNLFPFQDKVVDFSLSKDDENFIRKRTKDDYFTFTTDNEYKPDFDKAWLDKHASELLMTENLVYIVCFYTLLAHGLTNDNSIKLITFWLGEGDNGKSAMMNLYKSVMGDFCSPDASNAIKQKRGSCLDTEKFVLVGKRVATQSELKKEDNLDTTFVKNVSGDDKEHMLRPKADSVQIPVIIDCKFIIPSNEMPHIPERDHALLKRLVCFNFCNTFARSSEKMKEILSKKHDLFTYLCNLASELTQKKFVFTQCEEMTAYTREIKNSFDSVGAFMDDWMEMTDNVEDFITAHDLYNLYYAYCIADKSERNKREPLNKDAFGKALRKDPYNYNCKERKKKKKVGKVAKDCYFFIKRKGDREVNDYNEEEEEGSVDAGIPDM